MKKQLYVLTDGREIQAVKGMTVEEAERQNFNATAATGGEWTWVMVCPELTVSEYSTMNRM